MTHPTHAPQTLETAKAADAGEQAVLAALEERAGGPEAEQAQIAQAAEALAAPGADSAIDLTANALVSAAQGQPTPEGQLVAMRGALDRVTGQLATAEDTRGRAGRVLKKRWSRPSGAGRVAQAFGLALMVLCAKANVAEAGECEDNAAKLCARMGKRGDAACIAEQTRKFCGGVTGGGEGKGSEGKGGKGGEGKGGEGKGGKGGEGRGRKGGEGKGGEGKGGEGAAGETPQPPETPDQPWPAWLWALISGVGSAGLSTGLLLILLGRRKRSIARGEAAADVMEAVIGGSVEAPDASTRFVTALDDAVTRITRAPRR